MLRFELRDASSSKFWEIELNGASFTTRYGAIGAPGKSTTKNLDDDAKAKQAHDKLVSEKLAKGYVKIEESAPPARTSKKTSQRDRGADDIPPPPMSETRLSAGSNEPRLDWAPAIARAAAKQRDALESPAKPMGDAASLHEVIRNRLAKDQREKYCESGLARIKNGLAFAETFTPTVEYAIATYGGKGMPGTLSAEREGAALLLVPGSMMGCEAPEKVTEDLIDFWVAHSGLAFALEAFAMSLAPIGLVEKDLGEVKGEERSIYRRAIWLDDRDPAESFRKTTGFRYRNTIADQLAFRSDRTLRAHLRVASPTETAKAKAAALELRSSGDLFLRSFLSSVFLDPDWIELDLSERIKLDEKAMPSRSVAFTDVAFLHAPSVATLTAYFSRMSYAELPFATAHDDRHDPTNEQLPLSLALLDRYRESAVDPLVAIVMACVRHNVPAGLKELLRTLGYFSNSNKVVLAAMAVIAANQNFRPKKDDPCPLAIDCLRRSSTIAIPFIERAAKQSDAWAIDILEPFQRLANAAEATPPTPPAPTGSVTAKPKRSKKTMEVPVAAAKVVRGLPEIPFTERIRWEGDDKARWASGRPVLGIKQSVVDAARREADSGAPVRLRHSLGDLQGVDLAYYLAKARFDLVPVKEVFGADSVSGGLARNALGRADLDAIPGVLRLAHYEPKGALLPLSRIDSPKIALFMAQALSRTKAIQGIAKEWFLDSAENAAIGLIPIAVGEPSPERKAAEDGLRYLMTMDREELVREVAARYGNAAFEATLEVLGKDSADSTGTFRPPTFWQIDAFTQPERRAGGPLPRADVEALGAALFSGNASKITAIRETCTAPSLAAFAWDLFSAWRTGGAPAKESWALAALGHLGNDETVRQLAPLLRVWPGEGAHQRAVSGLDALTQLGSNAALLALHGIAETAGFPALQDEARAKMELVAKKRRLTVDELSDRLVPDLGLDSDCSRIVDHGSRQFRVGFDEALTPFVRDLSGGQLDDLPKPKKASATATSSSELWSSMKDDVRALSATQVVRLENAMVVERRWTPQDYGQFLVGHPILFHLVRRLVWAAFSSSGKVLSTFRVSKERTFLTVDDSDFQLPTTCGVGIVHPLALPKTDAADWLRVFTKERLSQPFEQLARKTYELDAKERTDKVLERFEERVVATKDVLRLQTRGWRLSSAEEGGVISCFYKPFTKDMIAGLRMVDGINVNSMRDTERNQTLGYVDFGGGVPASERARGDLDTIADVPKTIMSEVIRDLETLSGPHRR